MLLNDSRAEGEEEGRREGVRSSSGIQGKVLLVVVERVRDEAGLEVGGGGRSRIEGAFPGEGVSGMASAMVNSDARSVKERILVETKKEERGRARQPLPSAQLRLLTATLLHAPGRPPRAHVTPSDTSLTESRGSQSQ